MSEHTPGPWTAFILDKPLKEISSYVENTIKASGGDTFYFVGAVDELGEVDVCHVGNGPRSLANARLIASVPDMLKELEEAKEEINRLRAEVSTLQRKISRIDCRYAGQYADIGGSHCPIECPCDRCKLESELEEARDTIKQLRNDSRQAPTDES